MYYKITIRVHYPMDWFNFDLIPSYKDITKVVKIEGDLEKEVTEILNHLSRTSGYDVSFVDIYKI